MAKRKRKCSETGCKEQGITGEFCRLHYLKNWHEIVRERRVKAREKLSKYVENLSDKHPEDAAEVLEEGTLRKRLHEFGFREELEGGDHNPFAATDLKDLLDDIDND